MWLETPRPRTITRAQLQGIPEGDAGAVATLERMRDLVQQALRDPVQQIRELAMRVVGHADYKDQARALQAWVQTNIRYIRDPPDFELVQTPGKTLEYRAGDCDDQATLLAALLHSVGHPARFAALGFNGRPFSHVMVQTLIGRFWWGAETIIPRPLGWMPRGITKQYNMSAGALER